MNDRTRSRLAIDLDALEAQLRAGASGENPRETPQENSPAARPRPNIEADLSELARIVGQEDPFRALLANGNAPGGRPPARPPAARYDDGFAPSPSPATPGPAEANRSAQEAVNELERAFQFHFEREFRDTEARPQQTYGADAAYGTQQAAPEAYGDETADREAAFRRQADDSPYAAERDYADEEPERGDGYAGHDRQRYGYEEQDYIEDPNARTSRPRRGLLIAAALVGVAALGTGGVFALRSSGGGSGGGGEVPVIKADTEPTKVQPENPGGADIPNQNKQIYERVGQAGTPETKVVDRQEQPVDVNQALREETERAAAAQAEAAARAAAQAQAAQAAAQAAQSQAAQSQPAPQAVPSIATLAGAAAGTDGGQPQAAAPAAPAQPAPRHPAAGLGEPRRVKTVSVRPDGSVVSETTSALGEPAAARPKPQAAPTTPRQAAREDSAARASGAPLSIAPLAQRNTAPARQMAYAPADDGQAAASAPAASGGGFAVQLGAPGSETEARDMFASLQRKYPTLGAHRAVVQRAESGGRTVYRLRVGGLSREGANALCGQLKSSGGACFVTRN